ncbi:hypothetical protein ACRC7T_18010 (plasmid) [Segnochrobactraceae bacterium EtOH-i3]
MKDRPLSLAEKKRLEKFKNRRGRKNPSKVPARLARTSAFAPKRSRLNTDSDFDRLYVVPGHSVIRVSGRELGTQHRDAIYAVFRLPSKRVIQKVDHNLSKSGLPFSTIREVNTTWRGLLQAMNKTQHTNNLMTLLDVFEDIKKVVFTIFEGGDQEAIAEAVRAHNIVDLQRQGKAGAIGSLIDSVLWEGLELDSEIVIRFGDWSAEMIERAKLVSLNSDVQFALKSDHAKTFWPYIDSMNNHNYIDEDILSALAGRNLWSDDENNITRGQFRKDCKQAFDDMVKVGGITDYKIELIGSGRRKSRRYYYSHSLKTQLELSI